MGGGCVWDKPCGVSSCNGGKTMIDINKTYRTRDGREVRIYATDGGSRYSIHGAVSMDDGWFPRQWTINGELSQGRLVPSDHDLIEFRPRHKRTVWVNAYADDTNSVYRTKERADGDKHLRIACIKVDLDFEEGEGL